MEKTFTAGFKAGRDWLENGRKMPCPLFEIDYLSSAWREYYEGWMCAEDEYYDS